jgi:hypothetical protein
MSRVLVLGFSRSPLSEVNRSFYTNNAFASGLTGISMMGTLNWLSSPVISWLEENDVTREVN